MAGKKKPTNRWLREWRADPFVQRSRQQESRARSSYKLTQIDERDRLLRKGQVVVDLGAAPGGWSIEASRRVGASGKVVAVDLLRIEGIPGVEIIQGDFTQQDVQRLVVATLPAGRADVVISDMAPNIGGIRATDQANSMELAESAWRFAEAVLMKDGAFLVKLFQGEGVDDFRARVQQGFCRVVVRKPDASRGRSREFYLLGLGYKNLPRHDL